MSIEREFVSYEQALDLKELGFDWECFCVYIEEDKSLFLNKEKLVFYNGKYFKAPTFSQAFRWFREKYGLEGVVQQAEDFTWYKWKISQYNEDGKKYVADWYEYKTYEEAELECLISLINIVKNGKKKS